MGDKKVHPWMLARRLNRLSQEEVSRRSGVDQSFYSKIERRLVSATPEASAQLWSVLGPENSSNDVSAMVEAVRDPSCCPIDASVCYDLAVRFTQERPGWSHGITKYWIDPNSNQRIFVPAFNTDLQASLIWWLSAWSWALHGLPTRIPGEWEDFEPWAWSVIDEARPTPRSEESEADEVWPMQAWVRLDRESRAAVRLIIERMSMR